MVTVLGLSVGLRQSWQFVSFGTSGQQRISSAHAARSHHFSQSVCMLRDMQPLPKPVVDVPSEGGLVAGGQTHFCWHPPQPRTMWRHSRKCDQFDFSHAFNEW